MFQVIAVRCYPSFGARTAHWISNSVPSAAGQLLLSPLTQAYAAWVSRHGTAQGLPGAEWARSQGGIGSY